MRCIRCNKMLYVVSEAKYKDRIETEYRCMDCGFIEKVVRYVKSSR